MSAWLAVGGILTEICLELGARSALRDVGLLGVGHSENHILDYCVYAYPGFGGSDGATGGIYAFYDSLIVPTFVCEYHLPRRWHLH